MTHTTNKTSVVTRINDAMLENPLAAGLLGAGLAWIIFGNRGLNVAPSLSAVTNHAGSALDYAGRTATTGVTKAANAIGSAARSVGTSVGQGIDDAQAAVASLVPNGWESDVAPHLDSGDKTQSLAASGREQAAKVQSAVAVVLERQPLLLGALGIAIGAGIATSFRTTDPERDWMGEASAASQKALSDIAANAGNSATHVLEEVKDEATKQGLTPANAQDAVQAVGQHMKNMATPRE
jgi:hypothetical protein